VYPVVKTNFVFYKVELVIKSHISTTRKTEQIILKDMVLNSKQYFWERVIGVLRLG